MKKYISKSLISFNIKVNGKRRNISFDPVSRGGSVFITNSETIQDALEKNPLFNDQYFLVETILEEIKLENNKEKDLELEDIEIDNLPDAREFLIEKGVNSNSIKNKVGIKSAAAKLGYSFPNLN